MNRHLKHVVSSQASILELPHGPQSNVMMVCFLIQIKLQMSYAHYFWKINCNRVQSLDYMICVEVEQRKDRPYKNTINAASPNSSWRTGIGKHIN